ncbi:hypothetical protein BD770DRAFT_389271 [Pilaira anomala]|nr:hypothetical protein BD770DRAFT_389271 [Pilaira anomala]
MRELVARKEGKNEDKGICVCVFVLVYISWRINLYTLEILRLLKSLTFDESHMKVNRKITTTDDNSKKSRGHWFSSSSKPGKNGDMRKIEPRNVYGQSQPSGENDIFGGFLRLEENGDIPRVVSLCIHEVEERGLESVGIYRLSGPASAIQKYRGI